MVPIESTGWVFVPLHSQLSPIPGVVWKTQGCGFFGPPKSVELQAEERRVKGVQRSACL